MTNEQMALGKAVEAIYFNDSSDYETALWQIVELLGGNDAVGLLEADGSAAYHKYAADMNATPNDQHEGPEASAACCRSLSMRQLGAED